MVAPGSMGSLLRLVLLPATFAATFCDGKWQQRCAEPLYIDLTCSPVSPVDSFSSSWLSAPESDSDAAVQTPQAFGGFSRQEPFAAAAATPQQPFAAAAAAAGDSFASWQRSGDVRCRCTSDMSTVCIRLVRMNGS